MGFWYMESTVFEITVAPWENHMDLAAWSLLIARCKVTTTERAAAESDE